jgi:hypothetical protein
MDAWYVLKGVDHEDYIWKDSKASEGRHLRP